jgi:hypothetical protein
VPLSGYKFPPNGSAIDSILNDSLG